MKRIALFLLSLALTSLSAVAQNDLGDPTFVPTVKVSKTLVDGDSIQYMEMSNVYVYPQMTFGSKRQQIFISDITMCQEFQ